MRLLKGRVADRSGPVDREMERGNLRQREVSRAKQNAPDSI